MKKVIQPRGAVMTVARTRIAQSCLKLERPNNGLRALEARRLMLEAAPPLFGFAIITRFATIFHITLDKSCFSHDSCELVAFNAERLENRKKSTNWVVERHANREGCRRKGSYARNQQPA